MNSNVIYSEYIRIHPTELYQFSKVEYIVDTRRVKESSLRNLNLNYSRRQLSEKSERKAKRAIKYMLFGTNYKKAYNSKFNSTFKFKVNFITLTLPSRQQHTTVELKDKLLNQFLIECKKKWRVENYIWKFEQQKNGNAHWHILTDQWIPYLELRNTWNRIVEKLGYITEFEKINHHRNPNTTDVHSLRKIKNVVGYVLKYMVKADKKYHSTIKKSELNYQYSPDYNKNTLSINVKKFLSRQAGRGRLWTCSTQLSDLKGGEDELDNALTIEIERLKKKKGVQSKTNEHFTGVFYFDDTINEREFPLLHKLLYSYVRKIFPNYQEKLILNT
jgi:hypothetical protein